MWHYRPPLDRVIRELKFGGLAYLASHLGVAIAGHARDELARVDLIVPVPLHWRRYLVRGYNQAHEIARSVGTLVDRPVKRVLRRHRSTRPQTSLPRSERRANLDAVIRTRPGSSLQGCRVALVDDVLTTGATLEDCARALKRGGATEVMAAVAARTPPPALLDTLSGRDLEGGDPELLGAADTAKSSVIHVGQRTQGTD